MRYKACGCVAMLLLAGCNEPPRDAFFTLSSLPQEPATQAPFRISETTGAPVLTRGPAGAWDSVDVLNPSVIRFKGKLLNFYSGFDGESWRTGLATSDDGMHWAKFGGNPVLSPGHSWDSQYIAANGAAIAWKGRILYLYQGQDAQGITRIGLATTSDGERLAKANRPVLDVGRPHAWDGKAVGDPYVIVRGSKLYLYYLGMDEHNIQRLGVAMSSDGERWTKFAGNPILDVGAASTFDENGLGEPSVVFSAPFYYMIYTGRSASESRDLGYAISSDGVSWKKMSTAGVFTDRKGWNDKVICDSTILGNDDGSFTVWYGGGDVARPDERIDGQIGRFSLTLAPPYVADGFDASVDYLAAGLRSTSILRGSWVADGGSAWVGPDASARIWSLPGDGQSIDISGWMPVSLYRKAGIDAPISLRATINGKQVAEKSFTSDELFHIRVLPKQLQGMTAPLFVELQTDHSFTPSTFSSSPDTRALSLKVSRVGLSR